MCFTENSEHINLPECDAHFPLIESEIALVDDFLKNSCYLKLCTDLETGAPLKAHRYCAEADVIFHVNQPQAPAIV